jgi:hypothetical protein
MIKRTTERNMSMEGERVYDVEEERAAIGGRRSDWR